MRLNAKPKTKLELLTALENALHPSARGYIGRLCDSSGGQRMMPMAGDEGRNNMDTLAARATQVAESLVSLKSSVEDSMKMVVALDQRLSSILRNDGPLPSGEAAPKPSSNKVPLAEQIDSIHRVIKTMMNAISSTMDRLEI